MYLINNNGELRGLIQIDIQDMCKCALPCTIIKNPMCKKSLRLRDFCDSW